MNHREKLQTVADTFPLNVRDEIDKELCDSFPYDIANQSDDFYSGIYFCLRMITDLYHTVEDQRRVSMLMLVVNYAWQERCLAENSEFPNEV